MPYKYIIRAILLCWFLINSLKLNAQCSNCDYFPDKYLSYEEDALLDFKSMAGRNYLDFLIGTWDIMYPNEDNPKGYVGQDSIKYFGENKLVLVATQHWFPKPDKFTWMAKSIFMYNEADSTWNMQWITTQATNTFFRGQLINENELAFYEYNYHFDGRTSKLEKAGNLYVFKNITNDGFLVEWYTSDKGEPYGNLDWRVYYRRVGG